VLRACRCWMSSACQPKCHLEEKGGHWTALGYPSRCGVPVRSFQRIKCRPICKTGKGLQGCKVQHARAKKYVTGTDGFGWLHGEIVTQDWVVRLNSSSNLRELDVLLLIVSSINSRTRSNILVALQLIHLFRDAVHQLPADIYWRQERG
jgi:hypothetical protein